MGNFRYVYQYDYYRFLAFHSHLAGDIIKRTSKMNKSEKKSECIPKCTYCDSDRTKKRFLRIPRIFFLNPPLVGGLVIIGGVLTILNGLASARPLSSEGPHDWLVEVVVGSIMVLLMIVGLIARTHKCLACGRGFNWPPPIRNIKVLCPKCGASLRGADSEMIGDTAICAKCKYEFEITKDRT